MKKIICSILVIASAILMISCTKQESEEITLKPACPFILEELQQVNQELVASHLTTKSSRSINGWELAKADAVGAYKAVFGSPWSIISTIRSVVTGNYGGLILKIGAKAAWASFKAYADSRNEDFEEVYTLDKYALCVEYIGNHAEVDEAGGVLRSGSVTGLMDDPILEPEPLTNLELPTEEKWTNELSREHNLGLKYLMCTEEREFRDYDEYINNLESRYGIDSLYKANLVADMEGITYDMDYSEFFDSSDLAGRVLVLFASLYEQYVTNYNDVVTIVNQYIAIVDNSEDLSAKQKTALIAALNVILQSNAYWDNVLSNTI
ncbi:MAG: hypothetical protein IJ543_00815 [Bacteroidales bacterium]|nr:hypothetical protein [Bacteroidales bacterium]